MTLDRRQFLAGAAGSALASLGLPPVTVRAAGKPGIRAVAFDAFPIFDPRPVFALAETLFPGRGAELSNAWRTRQFEYQWLRALSGRYADFWQTTDDALVFAARLLQLELSPDKRAKLMHAYLELKAWPDAPSALAELKDAGLRLAFLSNMTARMLHTAISNAGLEGLFARILSSDAVQTYKPDPRAYQVAVDGLGLAREEVLFVAFAGWDAAGANSFGFPTFWVNRLNVPEEELGVHPDGIGRDLADLVRFVAAG